MEVDDGKVTVQAGAVTVKVPRQRLRRAVRPAGADGAPAPRVSGRARERGEPRAAPHRAHHGRGPRGWRSILDDAFLAGLPAVRIIHGKGTGALRRAVEECLSGIPWCELPPRRAGGRRRRRHGRTLTKGGHRGRRPPTVARAPSRAGGPADEASPRAPRRDPRPRATSSSSSARVVKLKRAGENWKGLCPFHTEKTPSFTVNPKQNIFHCFGCGAGRRRLQLPARQERLDVPRGGAHLAERAGVALPRRERDARGRTASSRAARARDGAARRFYSGALGDPGGEQGARLSGAARRGSRGGAALRPRLCARGLGHAPRRSMRRRASARTLLAQAGPRAPAPERGRASTTASAAGSSSRSATRRAAWSRSAAARSAGEEPKYLNSPETPLYVKGQTLYALDWPGERCGSGAARIIVEGYLDCLMAHQHGFTETVAALGTAFTPAAARPPAPLRRRGRRSLRRRRRGPEGLRRGSRR